MGGPYGCGVLSIYVRLTEQQKPLCHIYLWQCVLFAYVFWQIHNFHMQIQVQVQDIMAPNIKQCKM